MVTANQAEQAIPKGFNRFAPLDKLMLKVATYREEQSEYVNSYANKSGVKALVQNVPVTSRDESNPVSSKRKRSPFNFKSQERPKIANVLERVEEKRRERGERQSERLSSLHVDG